MDSIRHHQNWRAKSLELQERVTSEDLVFTAPVSISKKDVGAVRTILLSAISEISKVIENSPAEKSLILGSIG